MDFGEAREGGVVVLSPHGDLAGTEDTSAFEAKLAAVHAAGARQLVIDCSSVGQMTGVAIRALLVASRKIGRSQGRLVLYGLNSKVRKAFALSGFDRDFTILGTREESLQKVLEPVGPAGPSVRRVQASLPVAVSPPKDPEPTAAAPQAPPAAVAVPPSRPAPDPREVLANVVLDALGVRVLRPVATGSGPATPQKLGMTADALLSALGPWRR
jgi:anti-anti-sigma factor